jgi:hypothetical protein
MPLAAVIATQLTDHSAHPDSLLVGGVDVILTPGTGGNRLGVPIESIDVREQGPGGVSSMEFIVDDLTAAWTLTMGDEVVLNLDLGYVRFRGLSTAGGRISARPVLRGLRTGWRRGSTGSS